MDHGSEMEINRIQIISMLREVIKFEQGRDTDEIVAVFNNSHRAPYGYECGR